MITSKKAILCSVVLALLIILDFLSTYYAIGCHISYDSNSILYEANTVGSVFNLGYTGMIISQVAIFMIASILYAFSLSHKYTFPSHLHTKWQLVINYFANKRWWLNLMAAYGFVFMYAQLFSRPLAVINNLALGVYSRGDFADTAIYSFSKLYYNYSFFITSHTPWSFGEIYETLGAIIFSIIFVKTIKLR